MSKNKTLTGMHWQRILEAIYDFAPNNWGQSKKMGMDDNRHPLAQKLQISGKQLMLGIIFLRDQGLINPTSPQGPNNSIEWNITPLGLKTVLEARRARANILSSYSLIFLTAVIFATAAFAFVRDLDFIKQNVNSFNLLLLYLVVLLIVNLGHYLLMFRPIIRKGA